MDEGREIEMGFIDRCTPFARKFFFSLHGKMGYLVLSMAADANGLTICGPRQRENRKLLR